MRHSPSSALLLGVLVGWILPGCSGGSSAPGVGITNVSQAAPTLPEFDPETNEYRPYYATAELNRPRYLHEGLFGRSGVAFVLGGSDERGLSTLDTVEFYDQAAVDQDTIRPESQTGTWFDTNFEGDPIVMENGPRIFFSVNELADGRQLIVGGTSDIEEAQRAYEKAEIFDPDTRTFETLEEEMLTPRFRHSTFQLFDGNFLILGGQEISTVTIINENIEPGQVGRQEQRTVFQSVDSFELFSVTEQAFVEFTRSTGREVTLNTPRGRAGQAVTRIAGFDNTLGSADDLYIIAGGFQTLTGQAAPRTKAYGAVGREEADALTVVEFLDPITRVVTQAGNINLAEPRIDTPHIMNLGQFNDFTLDGVRGMGNVLLITHGNSDEGCPTTSRNLNDELFVATFTGFGPAQGLQFTNVDDLQTFSQVQGTELPPGAANPQLFLMGRCQTNPVALPRAIQTARDVADVSTWVVALGGTHIVAAPGCPHVSNLVIASGAVFDPFFNLRAASILGFSPRSLTADRTLSNPTGVVGTWLTVDGAIPTADLSVFGTTPQSRWARPRAAWRVYAKMMAIPGADGIINTTDDRVLMAGGGSDGRFTGGEPAAPSSELFLPPGVNDTTPSD